jgi:hypothetical protein
MRKRLVLKLVFFSKKNLTSVYGMVTQKTDSFELMTKTENDYILTLAISEGLEQDTFLIDDG